MRCWLSLLVPTLLIACVGPNEDSCGAAQWSDLIGQPERAIIGITPDLRVIHPGQAVTLDYNPKRLNAEIDAQGMIVKLVCY